MKSASTVLVLTGPTGVGKTQIAMAVAKDFGAEIISADSRQVYKYLDIGTAKPNLEARSIVPHHLIDFLELEHSYSAAAFAQDARRIMEDLERQVRPFLVVGGTGLYIKALIDGLSPIPPVDPEISQKLQQQAREYGLQPLYERLALVDPPTAGRLSPNDRSRILRALEVFIATGRPISEWQRYPREKDGRNYRILVLTMERQDLYRLIDTRVEVMIAAGLVDEVKGLLAQGKGPALEHIRAVGYREMVSYLNGYMDLPTTVELIKRNTRRFAKRQLTWFRGMADAEWIDVSDISSAIKKISRYFRK